MGKDGMYYICLPLSAPTGEGIRRDMMKARYYMELVSCAVAPHAYMPELLNDRKPCERDLGLQFGMSFLGLCDGMIVRGEYISNDMRGRNQNSGRKPPAGLFPVGTD